MAARVLPNMMMSTTTSTLKGSSINTCGSNNMPKETKNSTAKASRRGRDSSAARWASSDSRIIMPAKKAPSAKETSNKRAEPYATPTAAAITHNENNTRNPKHTTSHSRHGNTRQPTTSNNVMKAAILPNVMSRVTH